MHCGNHLPNLLLATTLRALRFWLAVMLVKCLLDRELFVTLFTFKFVIGHRRAPFRSFGSFQTATPVPLRVVSAQILFSSDLQPVFDTQHTIGEIGNAVGFQQCDVTVDLAGQGDDAGFHSDVDLRGLITSN